MNNTEWWEILTSIALIFIIIFGTNACSSTDWNGGECLDGDIRYEMRGVSRGLKYYVCPECGNEVERY
jgi:hypothetical protein